MLVLGIASAFCLIRPSIRKLASICSGEETIDSAWPELVSTKPDVESLQRTRSSAAISSEVEGRSRGTGEQSDEKASAHVLYQPGGASVLSAAALFLSLIDPCSFPDAFPVRRHFVWVSDSQIWACQLAFEPHGTASSPSRDANFPENYPVNGNSAAETG